MPTYADDYKNTFSMSPYGYSLGMYDREPFSLEDMRAHLTEYSEIAYVSFPHTWYGYGTNFVALANNEYLKKFYGFFVAEFDTQLFIPREVFMLDGTIAQELQELFFMVQNDCPVIDDEIHSRLEFEAHEEFIFDEIRYELELDHDQFESVMQSSEIDISEWVATDNDGYTVYALKGDLNELMELLKEHI